MSVMVSPHFKLSEFAVSASYPELVRPVPDSLVPNVKRLAAILEAVRPGFGPLKILSGYRPTGLNIMVGGSQTSQHRIAEACDVTTGLVLELFSTFVRHPDRFGRTSETPVGQVIYYPSQRFVHIALPSQRYPVLSTHVHKPSAGWLYKQIPTGDPGIDWLIDHHRQLVK